MDQFDDISGSDENAPDEPKRRSGDSRNRRESERFAQRAAEHFRSGRLGDAEAELRKALAVDPQRGDWHFNLGLTLEAAGRLSDALLAFRDAAMRLPRRPETRLAEGTILCRLGRYEESISALEAATTLDHQCDPGWARLIEAHAKLGRIEEAESAYYIAQEHLERMPFTLVAMGDVQLQLGNHERAQWCYREALQQAPNVPRIRGKLGHALALGGSPDAGIRMYLEELRLHPGDVATLLQCGDLLATQHRVGEAIEKYRRAAEIAPTSALPHARLGTLLAGLGRPDHARPALETAYALQPDAPLVRLTLATLLANEGSNEAALRYLREEASQQRDLSTELAALEALRVAECLSTCGAPHEAIELLEQVLTLRPSDLTIARRLMVLSFAHGRRRRGRGLARRIARLDPGSAAARDYNLTLDAIESGRLQLAWARLRRASRQADERHPRDPELRRLRIRWLACVLTSLFGRSK